MGMPAVSVQTAPSDSMGPVTVDPGAQYPQGRNGPQHGTGSNRRLIAVPPAAAEPECGHKMAGGHCRKRPGHTGRHGRTPPSPKRRDPRKQEVEEQLAFQFRMMRAMARRAVGEDPGRGLAALMQLQERLAAFVDEVGVDLVSQVGPAEVAREIGCSSQNAHKRWGPQSKAAQAAAARQDGQP